MTTKNPFPFIATSEVIPEASIDPCLKFVSMLEIVTPLPIWIGFAPVKFPAYPLAPLIVSERASAKVILLAL